MNKIEKYLLFFPKFFTTGDHRSVSVKKNIGASLIYQAINVIISIIMVPLMLRYLGQNEYGMWLTIGSLITWIVYFDLGLGSGLRNRFAEAKAFGDVELQKIYVSTSYAILTITVIGILIIFFAFNSFINWSEFLNVAPQYEQIINKTFVLVFVVFSLQFILRLLHNILQADQKVAMSELIITIGNIISVLCIWILSVRFDGSIFIAGSVITLVPFVIILFSSVFFFTGKYKRIRPSISHVKFKYYKSLMSLGVQFFIIQLCSLITVSTTNIIISHMFGPKEVVNYNISLKYFSVILIVFSVFTKVLTSTFTEAFNSKNFLWIRNAVKKVNIVSFGTTMVVLIMALFADYIYKLWVGNKISVSSQITILIAVNTIMTVYVTVYAAFISGIGKLRIAFVFSIINAIIYIPLAFFLGKQLSVSGIILAQILIALPGLYWLPSQYKRLITFKATGIWNK